jgi:hypothetical protein
VTGATEVAPYGSESGAATLRRMEARTPDPGPGPRTPDPGPRTSDPGPRTPASVGEPQSKRTVPMSGE